MTSNLLAAGTGKLQPEQASTKHMKKPAQVRETGFQIPFGTATDSLIKKYTGYILPACYVCYDKICEKVSYTLHHIDEGNFSWRTLSWLGSGISSRVGGLACYVLSNLIREVSGRQGVKCGVWCLTTQIEWKAELVPFL